jgi:DNA polymerase-4
MARSTPDPQRVILHLDLDAFYAAVEVLDRPDLAGKPVLIGGRQRGVVAAASYPARVFGIHSAMPMFQALALCPEAIILPPRFDRYRECSRRVMDILHQTMPLVEQISIDEAYLELTDQVTSWGDGVGIAQVLQQRVKGEVGLSASLGVATNKLLAKVASDHDKPGGLTVVWPEDEAAFLAPLPVRVLWGIGPVTAQELATMGVFTVGDLADRPPEDLHARFGHRAAEMIEQAQGIDKRPVTTERERKSVSQERTFSHDLEDSRALRQQLWRLSQGVAHHLQKAGLAAGTVTLKLRYSDFSTLTRQMSLSVPTDNARTIYRTALVLLRRTWEQGRPVRLLGVAGHQLNQPAGQLPLF